MGSRYGHTAVVGGVAVGLVLAVLAVGGGSAANTGQITEQVLAASAVVPPAGIAPAGATPSVWATTTTVPADQVIVAPADRAEFCALAAAFQTARTSAGRGGETGPGPWLRQIEFLSVGATLVSPASVDATSGRSWRETLIELSDAQSQMNLQLEALGWDLGAYLDTSSSGVVEAPSRLIAVACG